MRAKTWLIPAVAILHIGCSTTNRHTQLPLGLSESTAEQLAMAPPSYYFEKARDTDVDFNEVELAYRWKARQTRSGSWFRWAKTCLFASVVGGVAVRGGVFTADPDGKIQGYVVVAGVGLLGVGMGTVGQVRDYSADQYEMWAEIVSGRASRR